MELGAAFLATIDLLPEPMLLVNVDAEILAANRAMAQQLGVARDAVVHRQLDTLVTDSAAALREYLQRCARSGQLLPGTVTLRLQGGAMLRCRAEGAAFRESSQTAGTRAVMLRLVPATDGGSAFVALNEKIHQLNGEIARRKFIEGALRKAEQAALTADRRKDEFLATLAHELRNPLAPIRNAMQIMAVSHGDEARIANARALVERQLKHMVRLIDDLMDVSRITRDRLPGLQRRRCPGAGRAISSADRAAGYRHAAAGRLPDSAPAARAVLGAIGIAGRPDRLGAGERPGTVARGRL